jgi:hypothetical protein
MWRWKMGFRFPDWPYKERELPIPDKLAASLKEWKTKANKSCNLLFPTAGCKPKLDQLDCCKAVAKRADPENRSHPRVLHSLHCKYFTLPRCVNALPDGRTPWNSPMDYQNFISDIRYPLANASDRHTRQAV